MNIVLIVQASILLLRELLQITHEKLSYFSDVWNLFDFVGLVLFIATASGLKHLAVISTILILNRGALSALRAFSKTRYFVHMIAKVSKDMIFFLLICFILNLCFTIVFIKVETFDSNTSFLEQYFELIKLSFMSDGEHIKVRMSQWEARFVFVLQILTNIVIMLNLLISIIGDSFDQV